MSETQYVYITSTGRHFEIRNRLTCKSTGVLYLITCNGCSEQYLGMTNDVLAKRFTVHRQQMNNPQYRKLGVSKHLKECSDKDIKFTVTPFFKISSNTTMGRAKEQLFINQFKPSLNRLTLKDWKLRESLFLHLIYPEPLLCFPLNMNVWKSCYKCVCVRAPNQARCVWNLFLYIIMYRCHLTRHIVYELNMYTLLCTTLLWFYQIM